MAQREATHERLVNYIASCVSSMFASETSVMSCAIYRADDQLIVCAIPFWEMCDDKEALRDGIRDSVRAAHGEPEEAMFVFEAWTLVCQGDVPKNPDPRKDGILEVVVVMERNTPDGVVVDYTRFPVGTSEADIIEAMGNPMPYDIMEGSCKGWL